MTKKKDLEKRLEILEKELQTMKDKVQREKEEKQRVPDYEYTDAMAAQEWGVQ